MVNRFHEINLKGYRNFLTESLNDGFETLATGVRVSDNIPGIKKEVVTVIATYKPTGEIRAHISAHKDFEPLTDPMNPLFRDYGDPEGKVGPSYESSKKHDYVTLKEFLDHIKELRIEMSEKQDIRNAL